MLTYNNKVIELPRSKWGFFDFEHANGNDPIEDWYENDLSEEGQYAFDALLRDNHKTELPIHWIGFKRYLKGKDKEQRIWELEFKADDRQYRVLGKFGSVRKQAILLCGCYHKQRVYTPADALETAYKRAKALAKGEAKLRERQIKENI